MEICDCHVHVFGEAHEFPYAHPRVYTPSISGEEELLTMHKTIGVTRTVIVQPSPYGTDNRRLLQGLKVLGNRARGIAVIDESFTHDDLNALNNAGVRGIRLNITTSGDAPIDAIKQQLEYFAQKIKPFNWHIQVYMKMPTIEALQDTLTNLPVPLMIDHFGWAQFKTETRFHILTELVKMPHINVKISAIKRLCGNESFELATPFIDALIEANPHNLVWASDFPHTGGARGTRTFDEIEPFQSVDDGAVMAYVKKALGKHQQQILADNPARIYGF